LSHPTCTGNGASAGADPYAGIEAHHAALYRRNQPRSMDDVLREIPAYDAGKAFNELGLQHMDEGSRNLAW
jgi:hypothetical protein